MVSTPEGPSFGSLRSSRRPKEDGTSLSKNLKMGDGYGFGRYCTLGGLRFTVFTFNKSQYECSRKSKGRNTRKKGTISESVDSSIDVDCDVNLGRRDSDLRCRRLVSLILNPYDSEVYGQYLRIRDLP